MSLRLGRRVLASEDRGAEGVAEYERQRARGLGTMAAQFRLGPRVTAHHETAEPAEEKKPKPRGRPAKKKK